MEEGNIGTVGISPFCANVMQNVRFVKLPAVGTQVTKVMQPVE